MKDLLGTGHATRPLQLLLIDGNSLRAATIKDLLQGICVVDDCPSGIVALRRLQSGRFYDIIVLSDEPRELSGLEVLAELNMEATPRPVVYLSGKPGGEDALLAWRLGVLDIVRINESAVHELPGRIIRAHQTYRSAREKEKLNHNLRHANQRFRDFALVLGDWIWETDRRGNITYVGGGGMEFVSLPPESLEGRLIYEILDGDGGEIQNLVAGHGDDREYIKNLEIPMKAVNGRRLVYAVNVFPISDEVGQISGYRGLCRDITESKEYEKALIKEKLHAEEANRSKGQLLKSLSHELRTPLQGIAGVIDLLKLSILTVDQEELLDLLEVSTRNLEDLITDLNGYNEADNEQIIPVIRRFSPSRLLKDLASPLRRRAMKFGLRISVQCQEVAAVYSDPVLINYIIEGLTASVLDFLVGGGLTITMQQLDEILKFEILFNEVDVNANRRASILEAFKVNHPDVRSSYPGIGLGLTIVRERVDLLDGHLEVDTLPDGVGILRVTIPVSTEKETSGRASARNP